MNEKDYDKQNQDCDLLTDSADPDGSVLEHPKVIASKESHQILGMYVALATSSELGKIPRAKSAALLGIGRFDQDRRRKHEHRFILGSLI